MKNITQQPLKPKLTGPIEKVGNSIQLIYGPHHEKICLRGFANNTGADQPAHPRNLISAFVIRFYKSTICRLAADEITIF